MRIALFSTIAVPTPPPAYGGIELFVGTLARGLVERGDDVVVYATADSRPAGELRSMAASPVWPPDYAAERRAAQRAWNDVAAWRPDVVHVNLPDVLPDARGELRIAVTIHHPRVDRLLALYAQCAHATRVAVSARQAHTMAELEPLAVIHHGVDVDRYPEGDGGRHVAFLGRIGPEKAPHLAIDAAARAGVPLRIGGPQWTGEARYEQYFDREMAPRLSRHARSVRWLGEVDHARKLELLRGARALLMPSAWQEPFGLVMIEAMLVGTPVIAFDSGSAAEVVDGGVTGFVVHDVDGMAGAIADVEAIDRGRCRERARRRFDAARMTDAYRALYRTLAG